MNTSKVPCQFIYGRYAPENPEMFTSVVEKYTKTVTTYRVLRFHRETFLMYVENVEMDNSLKCVSRNVVSGQITSHAL